VQSGDIWFAAAAVDAAAAALARLLDGQPDGFTVAAARDTLGTSRRYVLPLLARLDATGVTRREGDLRTAGPRMPPVGTDGRGDEQAGR
jgi:selenocysteine-specific elongation factor